MSRIPDDLAIRYGELLEAFDDAIKTVNESKSNTLDDLRSDLRKIGMVGAEITTEIAMLKGAVKLNRMTQVERQKADEKDDGVADYLNILSLARARAHVRGEEHDADGVIIEPDATPAGAVVANGSGVTGGESAATGGRQISVSSQAAEAIEPGMVDPGVGQTPTNSKPDAAMRPQTGGVTLVANSEPLEVRTADALMSGAAARKDADSAAPNHSNVTQFPSYNRETHFLSSKGLPRLHGCVKPEACGGSHRALCFSCERMAHGTAQGGAV